MPTLEATELDTLIDELDERITSTTLLSDTALAFSTVECSNLCSVLTYCDGGDN